MNDFYFVFQVPVASDEAANNIIIELDLDNSLFGFPRELVVAGAGKSLKYCCWSFYIVVEARASNLLFCWLLKKKLDCCHSECSVLHADKLSSSLRPFSNVHDGTCGDSFYHLVRVYSQVKLSKRWLPPPPAAPRRVRRWDSTQLHGIQEVAARSWVSGWEWKWRGDAVCKQNLTLLSCWCNNLFWMLVLTFWARTNELIFVSQTDRLVLSLPDWIRRK